MKYLIGIDGGGTNSRLLAVNRQGEVVGRSRGGSTNIESNPPETVRENLRLLVEAFCRESGRDLSDCVGACLGTAGVDTPETKRVTESLMAALSLPCPVMVVNDAEIALAGQTKGGPGIILISGTGSIGYGVNGEGEALRVGGYGYLVGDEGSSYWVAKEAISAALKAQDQTGPDTMLGWLIVKEMEIASVEHVIDFIYCNNKSDIARLSPLVPLALREGDTVARDIMGRAADDLAAMAMALGKRLGMAGRPYPLVFSGGFLLNTPWLMEAVKARVHRGFPLLTATPLEVEAEWGAIYLVAGKVGFAL